MKILTKEEEADHYNATLIGGILGGGVGILGGLGAASLASARFPAFGHLTLQMKAFLVTSSGTFAAIISADRASRRFEIARHPEEQKYQDKSAERAAELRRNETTQQRMFRWMKENRYPIVGGSWAASMVAAFAIVHRSPLSLPQKVVQARVYAQGLTVAVIVATAVIEVGDSSKGEGRYETVQVVDPNDPEHKHLIEKRIHHERYAGEDQWKDMVAAEEEKLKTREHMGHEEAVEHKKHKSAKHEGDEAKEKPEKAEKASKGEKGEKASTAGEEKKEEKGSQSQKSSSKK